MRYRIAAATVIVAVPTLLAAGCSSSTGLVDDETPRSIYCKTIPYTETFGLPTKETPLGVDSVELVTNTADLVEFDINFTGALVLNKPRNDGYGNPYNALVLDMSIDSADSPEVPDSIKGAGPLPYRSSEGKYSIKLRAQEGSRYFDIIDDEGNLVDKSDVTWEPTDESLRIGFDPAILPKLPAGKNYGYSLTSQYNGARGVLYDVQTCSDSVSQSQ